VLHRCARGWVTVDLSQVVRFLGGLSSVSVPSLVRAPRYSGATYNRSLISLWLDYSAPHLVRNMGNMRYEDRPASLFSGEHVLSQGIYVVGSR